MRWLVLAALVSLASACDVYDKPNRPLPESFRAMDLEGRTVDAASLRGRPWAINLWVPG